MEPITVKLDQPAPRLNYFEKNQVLTHEHLNNFIQYFDFQNRLTRAALSGVGIVSGLEVISGKEEITVTRGIGLTSDGDLIWLKEDRTFSKVVSFSDSQAKYPSFRIENNQVELFELLGKESEKQNTKSLSGFFSAGNPADDFAVILYAEQYLLDSDLCSAENCDNAGKTERCDVHALLIRKAQLDQIITENKCCTDYYYDLREIAMPRVIIGNRRSLDFSYLAEQYLTSIGKVLPDLAASIEKCEEIYASLALYRSGEHNGIAGKLSLGSEGSEPVPATSGSASASVNRLVSLVGHFQGRSEIQYVYDLVRDVVAAYNEFRQALFEVCHHISPDVPAFSKHLMLGELGKLSQSRPSAYRQCFIESAVLNHRDEMLKKSLFNYERLVALISSFDYRLRLNDEIKVTPSADPGKPLGDQAIPFYYDASSVASLWNFEKTRRDSINTIPGYEADQYSDLDQALNPLYYYQPSFYRIEGHLGQDYQRALRILEQKKEDFGLPVNFMSLALGNPTETDIEVPYCQIEDLELEYRMLRQEIEITYSEHKRYFERILAILKRDDVTAKELETRIRPGTGSVRTEISFGRLDVSKGMSAMTGKTSERETRGRQYQFRKQAVKAHLDATYWKPSAATLLPSQADLEVKLQSVITSLEFIQLPSNLAAVDVEEEAEVFDAYSQLASKFALAVSTPSLFPPELNINVYKDGILNHLYSIEHNNYVDALTLLKREYQSRLSEALRRKLLSQFLKDHPGISHAGGVPAGGTFILVYQETSKTVPITTGLSAKLAEERKEFDRSRILESVGKSRIMLDPTIIRRNIETTTAQIFERMVVADFYLPYSCCSDCAPQTYVFIGTEESDITPRISIGTNSFSEGDKTEIPVEVFPDLGGTVSGSGVENINGAWVFIPDNAGLGKHQLIHTFNDLQASVEVEVFKKPSAAFKFKVVSVAGSEVAVQFENNSKDATSFEWDFGNGTSSEGENPVARFTLETEKQKFAVTLIAKNGAAEDTAKEEIELKAGAADQVKPFITIKPEAFSEDDTKRYEVIVTPQTGGEVQGPGIIKSGNQWFFQPSEAGKGKHQIAHVFGSDQSFAAVEVFAKPSVQISFKETANDGTNVTVAFQATFQNVQTFEWDLGNGTKSKEENPVAKYKLVKPTQVFTVTLTVKNGIAERKEVIPVTLTGKKETGPVVMDRVIDTGFVFGISVRSDFTITIGALSSSKTRRVTLNAVQEKAAYQWTVLINRKAVANVAKAEVAAVTLPSLFKTLEIQLKVTASGKTVTSEKILITPDTLRKTDFSRGVNSTKL